jgi:hypothetical protein
MKKGSKAKQNGLTVAGLPRHNELHTDGESFARRDRAPQAGVRVEARDADADRATDGGDAAGAEAGARERDHVACSGEMSKDGGASAFQEEERFTKATDAEVERTKLQPTDLPRWVRCPATQSAALAQCN